MKSKYLYTYVEVETPDMDIVKYRVHARIDYFIDRNYGADADGNRIEVRMFVEDVELLEVYEGSNPVKLDEETELIVKARIEEIFLGDSV
jgi:hypothetical protein